VSVFDLTEFLLLFLLFSSGLSAFLVALTGQFDDVGVMNQPVDSRHGHHAVREDAGLGTEGEIKTQKNSGKNCKRLQTYTLHNAPGITMLTLSVMTMEQASEQTTPQAGAVVVLRS
jgi:hypothetical protein